MRFSDENLFGRDKPSRPMEGNYVFGKVPSIIIRWTKKAAI